MSGRAVIFANGRLTNPENVRELISPGDFLILADGGSRHAKKLGLVPAVLIGDLDSTPAREVRRLESLGVEVIRFPKEKDETDLELALDFAVKKGYKKILVLAPFGGRLDQTLGNINLLLREDLKDIEIRMDDGKDEVFLIRSQVQVHGRQGETISLLPLGGKVEGVTTDGLQYPLRGETLFPEQTRGISNCMTTGKAEVRWIRGVLLVIHTRQGK
jgi:thiamine pyrophosphokinase